MEDPAWEVRKGMAVCVGGDAIDVAEEGGKVEESAGCGKGRAVGWFIVEVPENGDERRGGCVGVCGWI